MRSLKQITAAERGASLIEYCVLLCLIAIALIPSLTSISFGVNDTFVIASNAISGVADTGAFTLNGVGPQGQGGNRTGGGSQGTISTIIHDHPQAHQSGVPTGLPND